MNKTIKIDKDFFNVSKKTTNKSSKKQQKNNGENAAGNASNGLNALKKELLNRVHQNKNKRSFIKSHNPFKPSLSSSSSSTSDPASPLQELDNSINYLAKLSRQKNARPLDHTIKNNQLKRASAYVQLELPNELEEINFNNLSTLPITSITPFPQHQQIIGGIGGGGGGGVVAGTGAYLLPDPAYGCLKIGGTKPTFRMWNKTQKNLPALQISGSTGLTGSDDLFDIKTSSNLREERLKDLQSRLKEKNNNINNNNSSQTPTIAGFTMGELDNMPELEDVTATMELPSHFPSVMPSTPTALALTSILNDTDKLNLVSSESDLEMSEKLQKEINSIEELKQVQNNQIKQTKLRKVHRTFKLGKIDRAVAVLIKDNNTRKNITLAKRNLKNDTMEEVKKYLKDRNLIKKGSVAPNNIIRQIYENARMGGDIKNVNKENMMETFLDVEQ